MSRELCVNTDLDHMESLHENGFSDSYLSSLVVQLPHLMIQPPFTTSSTNSWFEDGYINAMPKRESQVSGPCQEVRVFAKQMLMTHRFYEDPTVTLIVGENKKPFYVHLNTLCDASPFFKAAFTGGFKESFEKTMQLPEDEESIFELFVDWLYYRRYTMLPEEDDDDEDDDNRFMQAFRLFVLAEKYGVSKLKSLVIETLFAAERESENIRGPGTASIAYAYEHTTQESVLRKLLADAHVWNLKLNWYKRPQVQAFLRKQPDFATDVILSLAKHLPRPHVHYNPFEKGDVPEEYKED